eukprot:sb/3470615/
MYGTPPSKKVGLPLRNLDYRSFTPTTSTPTHDVKRNLQPEFLDTLGRMCINGTAGRDRHNFLLPTTANHGDHGNATTASIRDPPPNNTAKRGGGVSPTPKKDHHNHQQHQHDLQILRSETPDKVRSTFCGICRKEEKNMTHYGVYPKDDSVDLVMGGVIERIDHLIDRLGKGQFDKKPFGKMEQKENVPGIMLPCEYVSNT